MSAATVGTSAEKLDLSTGRKPVLQNLGPGKVYVDFDPDVTTSTGLQLDVNDVYEFPGELSDGGGDLYAISTEAATDLRILLVG